VKKAPSLAFLTPSSPYLAGLIFQLGSTCITFLTPTFRMNKSGFFVACLLWGFCLPGLTQTPTKKNHWVVKTGVVRALLNASSFVTSREPTLTLTQGKSGFRTGFQFEFSREMTIHRAWSVVAGSYYRQYGGSFYPRPDIPNYDNRLDYLGLHGLVRFAILPEARVSPYLIGGARVGYAVAHTRSELTELIIYQGQRFKPWDVAPVIGAGLEFPFFQQTLLIEVEYAYGLTDITAPLRQYNNIFQNRAVAFTLGVKF
jgi:Outer membrane protein beta-barrel domain